VSDLPPPVPAATVIVVRDTSPGLEVLLLKRSAVGAFANFWVFPGGRVDDTDPGADDLERARHAAVREAREEVGLTLDPSATHPFSHWTPPSIQPRRFATWFFVAHWAGDDVVIDGHEIVDHVWMTPEQAIAAQPPMAPPTIVTLHELADAGSFAGARRTDPPRYVTRAVPDPTGVPFMMWLPDVAYETGDLDAPGPRHRLHYPAGGPWTYERPT
jgi:8-oxo-dGTP pyrophosphatase MutT (NUDIX family)